VTFRSSKVKKSLLLAMALKVMCMRVISKIHAFILACLRGLHPAKTEHHGIKVTDEATAGIVMILTPDEFQGQLYREEIEPNIKQGATIAFAHGFAIHYNQVVPRADLNVIMVAPKAPGHTVRSEFVNGDGIPDLIAIFQDATGAAEQL
jgi:ketol-acid reductoisomerase